MHGGAVWGGRQGEANFAEAPWLAHTLSQIDVHRRHPTFTVPAFWRRIQVHPECRLGNYIAGRSVRLPIT